MICSLLIENASKATSQGSDKKKNCKLKKRKRKQREALSLSEKKWCLWPSLLQLLYIRDLRFSWREILGKFSLLDYFKNSFIDIVCIVAALFLEEGLKKWKKPQFALNRKRIEMRFHILSMFNIWCFSGWFPWNTENCDGMRRSVKRYLFTSVTHTGQTYVFKIANFHCWNIVMSKNFKIIHFSFGAISWKLLEKFENVKQKNVIRNFDHVSWEKTFLSPDLGYTYLPMTVCLIKLKERKRLSSDEMLTVCTYVLYILW